MLHIEALAITIFNCQNLRKYNFLEIANFAIFIFRNLHEVIPFRKLQTILNITEQIFFLQKEVDFGGLATIKSEPNLLHPAVHSTPPRHIPLHPAIHSTLGLAIISTKKLYR